MPLTLKATNGNRGRGVLGIWGGFEVRSGFSASKEIQQASREAEKLGGDSTNQR